LPLVLEDGGDESFLGYHRYNWMNLYTKRIQYAPILQEIFSKISLNRNTTLQQPGHWANVLTIKILMMRILGNDGEY